MGVYGSKKFAKYAEKFPESLNKKPFILPMKHSQLRYDIEHNLKELDIKYNLIAEVQDSSVKKLMAEHGKGLVFLPDFAAQALVDEKRLYKLGTIPELVEEFWLVSKERVISSKVTEEILKNFKIR